MANFKKLLLALDLSPESESLLGRVYHLYADDVDQLHVVHVIKKGMHDPELLNGDSTRVPHAQRVSDHLLIKIRESLAKHGLAIPSDRIHLLLGEPASEIKRLAKEIAADLVIVGSHSKPDTWMSLPGATTNCVIQGIASDVMAVKV